MSLLEMALSVAWLMEPLALEAMLSVAAREPIPRDEIARRMHGPKSLALRAGQKRDDSTGMTMRDGVAVLLISGPIFRYADMFTDMSGGATTESLARDIQRALDDPSIKSLLLVIDSPGGESTGIAELSDVIYAGRSQKKIVAYIEGYGASAAYWLASAASEVVVDSTALVGSIGTVMGMWDPDKMPTKRIDFVSRQSPKKRPDPRTESGKAVLQTLVDDMTEVFIAGVMRNRNLSYDQVVALEGGMVIGQQAIEAGLADRLGSEEQILHEMALAAPQARAGSARGDTMKLSEMWTAFFNGAQAAGVPIESEGVIAPRQLAPGEKLAEGTVPAGMTAAPVAATLLEAQADPQVAILQAELTKLRAAQIAQNAEGFVSGELTAGRIYPAEQAALTALAMRAGELDATHPPQEGQQTLVALLSAAYAARPATQITRERLPAHATVLPAQPSSEAANDIEKARADARTYAEQANGKSTRSA